MTRLMTCLCVVFTLLVPMASAMAQTVPTEPTTPVIATDDGPAAIGTLIVVEGTGNTIQRAGNLEGSNPAQADMPIYKNDIIQTGADGKILILLLDDTQFTLADNAQFKIEDYVYDDMDTANNRALYSILQGAFMTTGGQMIKSEAPNVHIKTAYGTINARGAKLWGGMIDNDFGVYAIDGAVGVETNRGRIRVASGEGSIIRNINSIPERGTVWGKERIDYTTHTTTLADPAKAAERITYHKQEHMPWLAKHKLDTQKSRDSRIEELSSQPKQRRIDLKELQKQPASSEAAPTPVQQKTEPVAAAPVIPAANDINAPIPSSTATAAPVIVTPPTAVPDKGPNMSQTVPVNVIAPAETPNTPQVIAPPASPAPIVPPAPAPVPTPAPQAENSDPAFPRPAPSVVPDASTLPSDPAMRQEEIERMQLQHNGLGSHAPAENLKTPDPF